MGFSIGFSYRPNFVILLNQNMMYMFKQPKLNY